MKPERESPYMTTNEVADFLRLSKSTVLQFVKEGKLMPGGTDNKFIFRRGDIVEFGKTLFNE